MWREHRYPQFAHHPVPAVQARHHPTIASLSVTLPVSASVTSLPATAPDYLSTFPIPPSPAAAALSFQPQNLQNHPAQATTTAATTLAIGGFRSPAVPLPCESPSVLGGRHGTGAPTAISTGKRPRNDPNLSLRNVLQSLKIDEESSLVGNSARDRARLETRQSLQKELSQLERWRSGELEYSEGLTCTENDRLNQQPSNSLGGNTNRAGKQDRTRARGQRSAKQRSHDNNHRNGPQGRAERDRVGNLKKQTKASKTVKAQHSRTGAGSTQKIRPPNQLTLSHV